MKGPMFDGFAVVNSEDYDNDEILFVYIRYKNKL